MNTVIVSLLIDNGADPNIRDYYGNPAWFYGIQFNQLFIIFNYSNILNSSL